MHFPPSEIGPPPPSGLPGREECWECEQTCMPAISWVRAKILALLKTSRNLLKSTTTDVVEGEEREKEEGETEHCGELGEVEGEEGERVVEGEGEEGREGGEGE